MKAYASSDDGSADSLRSFNSHLTVTLNLLWPIYN